MKKLKRSPCKCTKQLQEQLEIAVRALQAYSRMPNSITANDALARMRAVGPILVVSEEWR